MSKIELLLCWMHSLNFIPPEYRPFMLILEDRKVILPENLFVDKVLYRHDWPELFLVDLRFMLRGEANNFLTHNSSRENVNRTWGLWEWKILDLTEGLALRMDGEFNQLMQEQAKLMDLANG